jgi:hypothetical protein
MGRHHTPYADIDIDADRTVLLVDDWGNIQRRFDIRPGCIVGVEVDWAARKHGQELSGPDHYWLRIWTSFGAQVEMLAPHSAHPDDAGQWFADILDELASLVAGAA